MTWVQRCNGVGNHVRDDLRRWEECRDRVVARRMIGTDDAVVIVSRDVVRKRESEHRGPLDQHESVRMLLHERVVIDNDVARASEQHERVAVAAPVLLVNIGEDVVANRDRAGLPTRVIVVEPENRDAGGTVLNHVVFERDVLHLAPRTASVAVVTIRRSQAVPRSTTYTSPTV